MNQHNQNETAAALLAQIRSQENRNEDDEKDAAAASPLAQPEEDDVQRIKRLRREGTISDCLVEATHWLTYYLEQEEADLESISTALTLTERVRALVQEQEKAAKESAPSKDFMLCLYNNQIQPRALEVLLHAPGVSIIEYHSKETPAFLIRIFFNTAKKLETRVQALERHRVSEAALTTFHCLNTPFPRMGQVYRLTTADGSRLLYFASFNLNWSQLIVEEDQHARETEVQA